MDSAADVVITAAVVVVDVVEDADDVSPVNASAVSIYQGVTVAVTVPAAYTQDCSRCCTIDFTQEMHV